jgi:hypothetical protein
MRRIIIDFIQDDKAGAKGRFLMYVSSEKDPTATHSENIICDMMLPVVKGLVLKIMPTPTGIGTGDTLEESRIMADLEADITEAGNPPKKEDPNGKS